MRSKHHSITPGWLRSSPGEISSPVADRFGSPILDRYLAMAVESICERICIQKDSRAGESDFLRKMARISMESVMTTSRPCRRFEMARSLFAAVFFAEAFAIVAGKGETLQSWEAIIDPPSHHTRTTPRLLTLLPGIRLFLHPNKIAGLRSRRNMPTNTLNCEPLSKFTER